MASGSCNIDMECREAFMIAIEKKEGKELPKAEKQSAKTSAIQKLLKEACQVDQKTSNYVDSSIFPKYMDKATKKITIDAFMNNLLPDLAAFIAQEKKGDKEDKLNDLKAKISRQRNDWLNAEKGKNASVVDRLTDVKGYTGSHKERFDADSGKGKGMVGRVDKQDGSGYVGNYKGSGTYDKTH